MRNDARPVGEDAPRDDARFQEQAIERSPAGTSRPGSAVDDEHATSSNTQHSNGLTGGSPAGGPQQTPERDRAEEAREHPLNADDKAALRTDF
jgi:hypothetical protein